MRRVATDLADAVVSLVEHHAEYVNSAELELLHEHWGQGEYPTDGWSYEDVLEVLKELPDAAATEYAQTGVSSMQESQWYTNSLDFLNESAFPRNDGVWINFEGGLGQFLSELLRFEVERYKVIDRLTDDRAAWLGKVAVLSRLQWTGDIPPQQWRALHAVIGRFNEDNADISTLA